MIGRILITGAAGAIGRTVRAALRGRYALLRLADIAPQAPAGSGEQVLAADCGDLAAMAEAASGMDAIVHLAVDPQTRAAPERAWRLIADTWAVLEAARIAGVRRFVFASSNHAAGMATVAEALAAGAVPRPDSLYGIAKVAGEAMARHHVDKHGMTAICVRIGSFRPEPQSPRDLTTWISPRDMAQLIERALLQTALRYAVVYGFSGNTRLPQHDPAWGSIGYHPQDDAERFADAITIAPGDEWAEGEPLMGAWFTPPDYDVTS